jgi:hypothetical protein
MDDKLWAIILDSNHAMYHRLVQRLAAGEEYPMATMLQGIVFAQEYPELAYQIRQEFKERKIFDDPAWLVKAADSLAEAIKC